MCLIAFAWQAHPRYSLVLAGNRDEFHARPTAALSHWPEAPHLLAGRDLLAKGTWLGVSERGRLAAVTNIRLPVEQAAGLRSRGALPGDFLAGEQGALEAAAALTPRLAEYGACNLLMFDTRDAVYAQNQPQPASRKIGPGIYGLSNATLDSPWPKTRALHAALSDWVQQSDDDDFAPLFAALANEHHPADADLPDTGIGLERERFVSPAFIRSAEYGTRCSSVVAIARDGSGVMIERRFGPNGTSLGESRLTFQWPVVN